MRDGMRFDFKQRFARQRLNLAPREIVITKSPIRRARNDKKRGLEVISLEERNGQLRRFPPIIKMQHERTLRHKLSPQETQKFRNRQRGVAVILQELHLRFKVARR